MAAKERDEECRGHASFGHGFDMADTLKAHGCNVAEVLFGSGGACTDELHVPGVPMLRLCHVMNPRQNAAPVAAWDALAVVDCVQDDTAQPRSLASGHIWVLQASTEGFVTRDNHRGRTPPAVC